MKTQINNSNFVKEAAILAVLLFLLCVLPSASVVAQTVQSAQYKFNSCPSESVVVRESETGVPVVSRYQKTPNAGVHFVYGDFSTGSAREFVIHDTLTVHQHHISYRINDMRVGNDMCYFCGVRIDSWVEPVYGSTIEVRDSTGIFGRFKLNTSGFDPMAKYDIIYLSDIKSLEHMAISMNSGDTMVAMVGIVDNSVLQSCLMVARVRHTNDPSGWKYHIKSTSSDTTEVFSDIAINSRHTVVTSYHNIIGGDGCFFLRAAKSDDVLEDDDYADFDYRYECRTNPLGDCARLIRADNAGIHLSAVPWTKKVYASFSCSMNACSPSHYQTAMFEINTNDMKLNAVQIVQKMYKSPTSLVDTKYLYRTYGDESTASVALLHLAEDEYSTVVEYPFALITSYAGYVPRLLVQLMEKSRLQSVSRYDGDDVRFGGQWGQEMPTNLTYLQEKQPLINDGSLCMQNSSADVMTMEQSKVLNKYQKPLQCLTENLQDLDWVTKTVATSSVSVDNTCIY